jgi:XTP/dITP diphosphohydrolase
LEVLFATSNRHKFNEAKEILFNANVNILHFDFKHNEIRSDSLEEIAMEAATTAYKLAKKPVFVEDTGLFIDALNGFPGTYSAWAQKKIGNEGILKLMAGTANRSASFKTCIAFVNGKTKGEARTFTAECKGQISEKPRGNDGFGYDPVFIPEGEQHTFAENASFKNKHSHRYKSLLLLANHLATDD